MKLRKNSQISRTSLEFPSPLEESQSRKSGGLGVRLKKWIKILLFTYIIVGLGLYFLQDKFLFHPIKLDSSYKYKFDIPFEEVAILYKEKDTISLVKFTTENKIKKGIVLYFHGNMENINHYETFVTPFTKNGYEVWMPDYPSFGKSTGTISEENLLAQANFIFKKLADKINTDSIIIYGKSLGTGIAANVASNNNAKMLILETPYFSIPSLYNEYAFMYPTTILSKYNIPTYEYLQKIKYPITIFHGTSDGVIPFGNAKSLEQFLKPTDKFITVPNATHININGTKIYFDGLDSLLKR